METITYVEFIVHITVLAFILFRLLNLKETGTSSMLVLFFAFGTLSFLASDLYWFAYTIMEPDIRMPFAANEIGEWALALLYAAALDVEYKDPSVPVYRETFLSVLFIMANTALWIAWSGEWLQDIMTGFTFGYFTCTVIRSARWKAVFSVLEWRLLAVFAVLIPSLQFSIFLLPAVLQKPGDLVCSALLFAGILWFFFKTAKSLRENTDPDASVIYAMAWFAWNIMSMYMSADPIYTFFSVFQIVNSILLFLAILRKTKACGKSADSGVPSQS